MNCLDMILGTEFLETVTLLIDADGHQFNERKAEEKAMMMIEDEKPE